MDYTLAKGAKPHASRLEHLPPIGLDEVKPKRGLKNCVTMQCLGRPLLIGRCTRDSTVASSISGRSG